MKKVLIVLLFLNFVISGAFLGCSSTPSSPTTSANTPTATLTPTATSPYSCNTPTGTPTMVGSVGIQSSVGNVSFCNSIGTGGMGSPGATVTPGPIGTQTPGTGPCSGSNANEADVSISSVVFRDACGSAITYTNVWVPTASYYAWGPNSFSNVGCSPITYTIQGVNIYGVGVTTSYPTSITGVISNDMYKIYTVKADGSVSLSLCY